MEICGSRTVARPSTNAVRDTHRIVTDKISIFADLYSEVEPVRQLQAVGPRVHVTARITARVNG